MSDVNETTRLDRNWPGGAASRGGLVRLELQREQGDADHSPDPEKFWMTPGQALALIAEMSKAAQNALKETVR